MPMKKSLFDSTLLMTVYKNFFFPGDILKELSNEEKRKRFYLFVILIITIFILIGYGLVHFIYHGGIEKAWVDLLTAILLLIAVLVLRKSKNGKYIYRTTMVTISCFLLHDLFLGLYDGGDILWFYMYPFIVFFLFGFSEGLLWNFFTMVLVFIILLFPDLTYSYSFSPEFKYRLIISLCMISFMAGLIEFLRSNFYNQLRQKKFELETALNNIKTLSGLLPICAHCKKIRDDKGYWNQIEGYIQKHSKAEFSHGMCPNCSDDLYGKEDWYIEMKEK
jgi:hypothetical protein